MNARVVSLSVGDLTAGATTLTGVPAGATTRAVGEQEQIRRKSSRAGRIALQSYRLQVTLRRCS